MDSVVPNGCSKAQPAAGSDGFVKLYDVNEARLRDLLDQVLELGALVRRWSRKSSWSFYTGLVCALLAVLAGLTVPFTGAVGFAVTAAVTCVAAGGAMFGFKIKQFRTEEESLRRIKRFLKLANRLEHELDRLQLEKTGRDPSLDQNLLKLFGSMDAFRAADGVDELTVRCRTVFEEFDHIRKQLEEFRTAESGEPNTELVDVSETAAGTEETRLNQNRS